MAEGKVLALLEQHNKPFNVQTVSDFLATHGVKKTACQKALDALAEQGKINCKVC
jgi:26S proteasome regulatory subunit (ATPase 3-interacting protein)